MSLSTQLVKNLLTSVCSQDLGNELVTATNLGLGLSDLSSHAIVGVIVATNVSQTVDFGVLAVGDIVVYVPAAAGTTHFVTVATAGTLGEAAVVGDLYIALRSLTAMKAAAVSSQVF
jgi:hypothetical protein